MDNFYQRLSLEVLGYSDWVCCRIIISFLWHIYVCKVSHISLNVHLTFKINSEYPIPCVPIIYLTLRTEHTITVATTLATVSCAMLALSIPIEGKRVPGRILILTVCFTGKEIKCN